jgi:hypothetical protein
MHVDEIFWICRTYRTRGETKREEIIRSRMCKFEDDLRTKYQCNGNIEDNQEVNNIMKFVE